MQKIVIATKNKGKVREMAAALKELPVEVVSLAEFGPLPDAVEDGKTFAENAQIKAAFYQQQTGCACIADDSGLEIEVLGGAPGVAESAADYRCALVFIGTDGKVLTADGRCDGQVKLLAKGENGFGYDPYFYPLEYPGRTMAELTLEEKQVISHRGKALKELAKALEDHWK